MGRFRSLMGRSPALMGRFTDFVLRGRFTSWKSTGKRPIQKRGIKWFLILGGNLFGNGPNTVSESTVSNTELSEFLLPSPSSGEGAQWVPLSLLFVCQSELTEFFFFFFSQNSPTFTQDTVRLSEFSSPKQYSRNSIPPVSSLFSTCPTATTTTTTQTHIWCNVCFALVLSRFCLPQWKRYFRCGI